jgi:methylase of polypeptide subunit release factors
MLVIRDHGHESFTPWKYNRLNSAPLSSSWTSSATPESAIHRIHAYPARFPALIVDNAFEYAKARGVEVKPVADVFCGSGTVTYEAAVRNVAFWGCDVNPVATLIARVKSMRPDPPAFERAAERIVCRFDHASSVAVLSPMAVVRLARWYEPNQFEDLARLRNAILQEVSDEGDDALAFKCAFSAILKPSSKWRSRSTKPVRDQSKRPVIVLDAFRRQCQLMAAAWSEIATSPRPASEIINGSVIEVPCPDALIDLIITSPPYATSYEYADLHQLSALWLGYVDDHRDMRSGAIGTSSRRTNLQSAIRHLNSVGIQIVFSLFNADRALAEVVATYLLDMQKVIRRCHDFLRPGGAAVFVVGNTQFHGVRIDCANHLVESLFEADFADIRVVKRHLANKPNTPYRSPDGRLSSLPTRMQIYGEEFIVMAQRR